MVPLTETVIATILLTKALEKSGEKLGEALMNMMGRAIAKIFLHSPEIATALESGDPQILNLDRDLIEKIPAEPIFTEFLDAADSEKNAKFLEKFQALKADTRIAIGKQINIMQKGEGNTQENNFFLKNPIGYSRKLEEDFTNTEIINKEELRYKSAHGYRLRNIGFMLLFGFIIAFMLTASNAISYGVIFIGVTTFFYWFCRMKPYHKYVYLDSKICEGNSLIYNNDRYRFVKDDGRDNYLVYDLTANCICDTSCRGNIQIVNAPLKEIEKKLHDPSDTPLVGICSLRKKKHSCRIDIDEENNEWFAVVAEIDWSEAEKNSKQIHPR
ncbi:MAG: hypothetical protein RLZZ135_669 [Cyanobacteriota bacterium]|jgi:hypothetical protein